MANRLIQDSYFNGRGIVIWSGNHIRIVDNVVHGTPASGIRANNHDYVAFENNTVYNCAWWTSTAESAIVFAQATNIDDLDIAKLFIIGNEVYDNRNFIPYYNENYDDPQYMEEHQMHEARPNYGGANQTFIIDGNGVYSTFKNDCYINGNYS